MPCDRMKELLDPEERAIVFFTKGKEFQQNPDHTGHTGSWRVSSAKVDRGIFAGITVFFIFVKTA